MSNLKLFIYVFNQTVLLDDTINIIKKNNWEKCGRRLWTAPNINIKDKEQNQNQIQICVLI